MLRNVSHLSWSPDEGRRNAAIDGSGGCVVFEATAWASSRQACTKPSESGTASEARPLSGCRSCRKYSAGFVKVGHWYPNLQSARRPEQPRGRPRPLPHRAHHPGPVTCHGVHPVPGPARASAARSPDAQRGGSGFKSRRGASRTTLGGPGGRLDSDRASYAGRLAGRGLLPCLTLGRKRLAPQFQGRADRACASKTRFRAADAKTCNKSRFPGAACANFVRESNRRARKRASDGARPGAWRCRRGASRVGILSGPRDLAVAPAGLCVCVCAPGRENHRSAGCRRVLLPIAAPAHEGGSRGGGRGMWGGEGGGGAV